MFKIKANAVKGKLKVNKTLIGQKKLMLTGLKGCPHRASSGSGSGSSQYKSMVIFPKHQAASLKFAACRSVCSCPKIIRNSRSVKLKKTIYWIFRQREIF